MPSETDDEDQQRNRGPTFTSVETNLLLDLVERHKDVLLNPDFKAATSRAKEQAWKLVQKELNTKLNCDRTLSSLKNKWKNLKTSAKKLASAMEPPCQDTEISRVNSILNTSNASSTHGYYDETDSDSNPKSSDPKRLEGESITVTYCLKLGMFGENEHYRNRADNFTPEEITLLLECVRKEKKYIMNPASNEEANSQKKLAWMRVAEEFNSRNDIQRNARILRTKFMNMKHSITSKNKAMLKSEAEEDRTTLFDLKKNIKKCPDNVEESDSMLNDMRATLGDDKVCNDTDSDSSDVSNSKRSRNRSGNFSAEESKLLLKCVREVKDIVLSPSIDGTSNLLKVQAWNKVTKEFNKLNPWPRSKASLRQRFQNMKALAKNKIAQKNSGIKRISVSDTEKLQRIKQEPLTYEDMDMDMEEPSQDEVLDNNVQEKTIFPSRATTIDPLDIVLNGPVINDFNHMEESNEIVKKKLELLKYQLETAELARDRIFKLLRAEETEEQLKATEMAIRLRTARLKMAAAEAKLPANHPALVFTPQETLAQTYTQSEIDKQNTS